MNIFKKICIRSFQGVLYLATFFLNFREPKLLKGENSFKELCNLIKSKNKSKALLVTDEGLHKLEMDKLLYNELSNNNIDYPLRGPLTAEPALVEGMKEYGLETLLNEALDNNYLPNIGSKSKTERFLELSNGLLVKTGDRKIYKIQISKT